ncbi:MAG: NAD(P)/FAD-dependent oxidoreductase [Rhodocyclaceae bacterium]|nr:NAD(P)/FAD-dependent oxidoreductase [Rhodocyclaceae bacterium]
MRTNRRRLLAASAALLPTALLPAPLVAAPTARGGRAVVVGGGWGGLAVARHLRALAPELQVTLVEASDAFHSAPLSNRWLAGLVDGRLLRHDYAAAAQAGGYAFVRARATAIDRDRRELRTTGPTLPYDWLILATGIDEDFSAWFGDEARPAEEAGKRFGSAWRAGGHAALKARLDGFAGGDFLMTVPPMPYRCPPAPFERACMIATLFRQRGLKARVVVLDPNPPMPGFTRVFGGAYRDRIVYVPQAHVRAIDPFARTLRTDFETFRFDDAILMPPQRAGGLARQAGLIGRDVNDAARASGWAATVGPDTGSYRSAADPRIFVIGDMIDRAGQLFGHYPKTGQMAARQGRIAAGEIAAEARGQEAPKQLPDSTCFVLAGAEPMETMRIETAYRFRGDGLIVQTVRQHHDAQPRDEDIDWARGMFAELLLASPPG